MFVVSGCTQKKLSREEQLAIKARNSAAAVQVYEGYTVDELAKAAEKVLYLIDPSDMKVTHNKNSVIGNRYYWLCMLIGNTVGYDTWVINFEEKENKCIEVSILVATIQKNGLLPSLPTPVATNSLTFETSALCEAEARLFYERLEYFLGKELTWRTCEKSKEWAKENDLQIIESCGLPFMCGHNWFGIEDKTPDYLERK